MRNFCKQKLDVHYYIKCLRLGVKSYMYVVYSSKIQRFFSRLISLFHPHSGYSMISSTPINICIIYFYFLLLYYIIIVITLYYVVILLFQQQLASLFNPLDSSYTLKLARNLVILRRMVRVVFTRLVNIMYPFDNDF